MKTEGRKQRAEGRKQKAGGSERPRTRGQGLGFALVAGLTCMISLILAQNGIARELEPSLTFRVRVYNYAQGSPPTLAGAEREADRIFSQAGVRAVWVDCLVVESATDPPRLCLESPGSANVELRILAKPAKNVFQDTVFGFAIHPDRASVYYNHVVLLAQGDDTESASRIILGCMMVHEIGHLLLGSNSHSETGIMRGQWEREDVWQAIVRRKLFTPEQAKLIRAEVRRRGAQGVLTMGMAPPSYGRSPRLIATGLGPTIRLRVYNYAQIAPSLLDSSEKVAATILAKAGLETHWVDCPLSPGEVDRYPVCRSELTASDFVIFILSVAMTKNVAAHAEALGDARPCPENAIGCNANLFYARVIRLASGEAPEYRVLGHALAHEIGYLLLGANSHSLMGIMRGAWGPSDLEVMAVSFLTFTPFQAERMQRIVRARASTQQTLEAKAVSK